jgi:type IV pilus assembly protein PilF
VKGLAALVAALALVLAAPAPAATTSPKNAAELNVQLGIQYLRQGNLRVAREKIERAVKQDPRNVSVQLAAALLAEQLGDPKKAETHYRQALRIEESSPEALNAYASYLCRKGRADEGESMFERAARNPLYRTPEIAYTNAGTCARSSGRYPEAEAYLRQALAIRPAYPDALMQMTSVAAARGNWLQVRAFVQRYLAVGPVSAEMLLFGLKAERALGDTSAAAEYASRLRRDFADSPETRSLEAGEERDPG